MVVGWQAMDVDERHGEEQIQTREVFDLVFPVVLGRTATKRAQCSEPPVVDKNRNPTLVRIHQLAIPLIAIQCRSQCGLSDCSSSTPGNIFPGRFANSHSARAPKG